VDAEYTPLDCSEADGDAVDRNNETPGCLARRLGQTQLYEAIKMHGVYAEVLLNYVERTESDDLEEETTPKTHDKYLASKLEYNDGSGVLLDDKGAPVMMKWETEIMRVSAETLLPTVGKGRVLNIGFGMGIIDGFLQERKPESHVIVEAHPTVIQRMKEQKWDTKPGVEVIHNWCPK
jgi:protein arginine N-methyltransferase 2